MITRFFISLSLCCALFSGFSAVPALEREVNLLLSNEPAASVFKKIQDQTGLVFSYSSSILNSIAPVSLRIKQKTVREALALILPKTVIYKTKNNYIILKERPAEKPSKKTGLSGYVYDKNTEKKIANVSIYDKSSMQVVTTDEYGFYEIKVPSENKSIDINKANYQDTSIVLAEVKENAITNIALMPVGDSLPGKDSITWRDRLENLGNYTDRFFRNFSGYINTINIQDTLHRPFQISFLPYIGTNHRLSGNVINHVSINIFGGYARGVEGFEAGGFFNVDKKNVKGVQLAGFFNMVGDSMQGIQSAGFFNMNGKSTEGVQAAGFFNSNRGETHGVCLAGFTNVNFKKTSGVQLAGFMNILTDSLDGFQGAGFLNTAKESDGFQVAGFLNNARSIKGPQVAGFLNHCGKEISGAQIAGFMNVADSVDGAQVAGFLNTARSVDGVQIAGFMNRAKTINGFQIGVVNISDSCNGVPIGIFNFVRHGLHQLEISGDEVFYTNLSFRTGVPEFYTVLSAGINPTGGKPLWTFGYAFGTSFKVANRLRSDITLGTQHVNIHSFTDSNSDLFKLYWGFEYRLSEKISIAGGPTFNLYLSDTKWADYSENAVAPYSLTDVTHNNGINLKSWVGGKLAIRFF